MSREEVCTFADGNNTDCSASQTIITAHDRERKRSGVGPTKASVSERWGFAGGGGIVVRMYDIYIPKKLVSPYVYTPYLVLNVMCACSPITVKRGRLYGRSEHRSAGVVVVLDLYAGGNRSLSFIMQSVLSSPGARGSRFYE